MLLFHGRYVQAACTHDALAPPTRFVAVRRDADSMRDAELDSACLIQRVFRGARTRGRLSSMKYAVLEFVQRPVLPVVFASLQEVVCSALARACRTLLAHLSEKYILFRFCIAGRLV